MTGVKVDILLGEGDGMEGVVFILGILFIVGQWLGESGSWLNFLFKGEIILLRGDFAIELGEPKPIGGGGDNNGEVARFEEESFLANDGLWAWDSEGDLDPIIGDTAGETPRLDW